MLTDALAWVVVALFVSTALLEGYRRDWARYLGAGAWLAFAAFWGALFPTFAFGMNSFVEGALSLLAVPGCAYVGYRLLGGQDELFVVTRAVAFMGVVYLPFQSVGILREGLVELVAGQTNWVIHALGYDPVFRVHPESGYRSEFVFTTAGHQYTTYIVLACTGIGSMAIFAGLIAAVDAPFGRKLRGFLVAIPVIYALNIARNAFIAVSFGKQYFQLFVPEVMAAVGYSQPGLVSFFIADRVISQLLSVVALVGVAWLVARELPELLSVAEDLLGLLTGRDVDLGGPGRPPARADGGDGRDRPGPRP